MENVFFTLAEIFGFRTVISAIAVCLILRLVKKKKPDLSEKAELGIRFLVSVIIGLLYLVITKTDLSFLFKVSTEICGVSLIFCGLFSKGNGNNEELLSKLLPAEKKERLDEVLKSQNESVCELEVPISNGDFPPELLNSKSLSSSGLSEVKSESID